MGLGLLTCGRTTGPATAQDTLIVSSSAPNLLVMEAPSGRVISRPGPVPPFVFTRSTDNAVAYYAGTTSTHAARELVAFDVRLLRVTQRVLLTDIEARSVIPQFELPATRALAMTPDGTGLMIAPARKGGSEGIAILSAVTGDVELFLDSLVVSTEGIVRLAQSISLPAGGFVIAVGRSMSNGSSNGWLFVLNASDLSTYDSVQITAGASGQFGGITALAASEGGDRVYAKALDTLYAYDVNAGVVFQKTAVPLYGRLLVSRGTSGVLLGESGDGRNTAGSGYLIRYTPDLATADSTKLRHSTAGSGPSVQFLATSADASRVYVLVGDPQVGPLYPAEPLSIIVLDSRTLEVLNTIAVNEWGGGTLLVR